MATPSSRARWPSAPSHLSLYQLTIEPGTPLRRRSRAEGEFAPPDADTAADLFELTQAMTAAAGLPAYEISNHARPGEESRHNLAYWRYDDYVGDRPRRAWPAWRPRHAAPQEAGKLARRPRPQRPRHRRGNAAQPRGQAARRC